MDGYGVGLFSSCLVDLAYYVITMSRYLLVSSRIILV